MGRIALFCLATAALFAADQQRVVTSVLPSLDYGPSCWSNVTLQNLSDRVVAVDME